MVDHQQWLETCAPGNDIDDKKCIIQAQKQGLRDRFPTTVTEAL